MMMMMLQQSLRRLTLCVYCKPSVCVVACCRESRQICNYCILLRIYLLNCPSKIVRNSISKFSQISLLWSAFGARNILCARTPSKPHATPPISFILNTITCMNSNLRKDRIKSRREGKARVQGEKPLGVEKRPNKLYPLQENITGPTLVEGGYSRHCYDPRQITLPVGPVKTILQKQGKKKIERTKSQNGQVASSVTL